MLRIKRMSVEHGREAWHVMAAADSLYLLAEVYCEFDHEAKSVRVDGFISDNCAQYREIMDFFRDHAIPNDYTYMTKAFSRGLEVASWSSAEVAESAGSREADSERTALLYAITKALVG